MAEQVSRTPRTGWIFVSGMVAFVLLASSLAWLHSFFEVTRNREVYEKVLSVQNTNLRDLRAGEDTVLNSYGWVDQQKGIVHIPIDRAIEIMAKEGREGPGPDKNSTQGG